MTGEATGVAQSSLNPGVPMCWLCCRQRSSLDHFSTFLPLLALIKLAYDVTPSEISGVPSSFNTEGYDVDAESDRTREIDSQPPTKMVI